MKYQITPRADQDIDEICDYIAQDNISAADRLDEEIHTSILLLARFPRMGHKRDDVPSERYLFWNVGNYVVAYRFEGDELLVVRVVHGARDFRILFPD